VFLAFGIAFVLTEILLLLDFGYTWNETWVGNYENSGSKFWFVVLVIFTVLFWGGIVGLSIASYVQFSCGVGIATTTALLVVSLALTIINATDWIEKGSILTSSFMSFILVYLNFGALAAQPEGICDSWQVGDEKYLLVVLDLILAIVALTYFAFKFSDQDEEETEPEEKNLWGAETMKYKPDQKNSVYFHLLMMTYGMSVALYLSNWGLEGGWQSYLSFFVREAQVVLLLIAFIWTMIAPKVLSNREF